MEEVYEFLKKCSTFYIATEDGDKPYPKKHVFSR